MADEATGNKRSGITSVRLFTAVAIGGIAVVLVWAWLGSGEIAPTERGNVHLVPATSRAAPLEALAATFQALGFEVDGIHTRPPSNGEASILSLQVYCSGLLVAWVFGTSASGDTLGYQLYALPFADQASYRMFADNFIATIARFGRIERVAITQPATTAKSACSTPGRSQQQ